MSNFELIKGTEPKVFADNYACYTLETSQTLILLLVQYYLFSLWLIPKFVKKYPLGHFLRRHTLFEL